MSTKKISSIQLFSLSPIRLKRCYLLIWFCADIIYFRHFDLIINEIAYRQLLKILMCNNRHVNQRVIEIQNESSDATFTRVHNMEVIKFNKNSIRPFLIWFDKIKMMWIAHYSMRATYSRAVYFARAIPQFYGAESC